jgi:hypothetical protein
MADTGCEECSARKCDLKGSVMLQLQLRYKVILMELEIPGTVRISFKESVTERVGVLTAHE